MSSQSTENEVLSNLSQQVHLMDTESESISNAEFSDSILPPGYTLYTHDFAIYQYDARANKVVAVFDNVNQAALAITTSTAALNGKKMAISRVVRQKQPYTMGFVWIYKKNWTTFQEKLNQTRPLQRVCQYSTSSNTIVNTFADHYAAAAQFTFNPGAKDHIQRVLNGTQSSGFGYLWFYEHKKVEALAEIQRNAIVVRKPPIPKRKRDQTDRPGFMLCNGTCNEVKAEVEFAINGVGTRERVCSKCQSEKNEIRRNEKLTFLKSLRHQAEKSTKKRAKKGRVEAGQCTLTDAKIMQMCEDQEGKCYYTGIPMSFSTKSCWQCSVERLDPSKGYVDGNVVLCVFELNGRKQWSLDKITEILQMLETPVIVDVNRLKQQCEEALSILKKSTLDFVRVATEIRNGQVVRKCLLCAEFIPYKKANGKENRGYCEVHLQLKKEEYANTMRGVLSTTLNRARRHPLKGQRTKKKLFHPCNLTMKDLATMVINQGGKCFYSGLPLSFTSKSEFQVSCERLDTAKGYTVDNCVLICAEFNIGCNQGNIKGEDLKQWSSAKFLTFYEHIKLKFASVLLLQQSEEVFIEEESANSHFQQTILIDS